MSKFLNGGVKLLAAPIELIPRDILKDSNNAFTEFASSFLPSKVPGTYSYDHHSGKQLKVVKGGISGLQDDAMRMHFTASVQNLEHLMPQIDVRNTMIAIYRDDNQYECVCPIFFSNNGSFNALLFQNPLDHSITIDLEITAMPLQPQSMAKMEFNGLFCSLFNEGLLQANVLVPWVMPPTVQMPSHLSRQYVKRPGYVVRKDKMKSDVIQEALQMVFEDKDLVEMVMKGPPFKVKKQKKVQKVQKVKKRCHYCNALKSERVVLRLCGGCQQVRYCSRRCQKKSWNTKHRLRCTTCLD